jgi:hypothetical protein
MRASQQLKSLFENFHSARRTRETLAAFLIVATTALFKKRCCLPGM